MVVTAGGERPFSNLTRQTQKMMEQLQKGFFYPNDCWTPNVNLYETANTYLVCVDLAGVDKEKIDVEVVNQRLRLRGSRTVPSIADGEVENQERIKIHLMEIDHGAFVREVELPEDANRNSITATYRDGLLRIEIPKVA